MKLKEYIEGLQKIADQYPDAEAIYSKDPEGNGFRPVSFTGSPGFFIRNDETFIQPDEFEWYLKNYEVTPVINAVCIN